MKFGMNLLLWTDDLTEQHLPLLEQLKELGYDGVELPLFDLDVDRWAAWSKRLDDLGLERTAVTVRGEEDNPISPDAKIRDAGVAANQQAVECCQAVGAATLVGPYHSALGLFSGNPPTGDEWNWGVESMQQVAAHAGTCGVTLGLEYLNRFECYLLNTAADMVRFVTDVGHENCQMMYDTFHAHIEEKDVAAAIQGSAKHTVHVHISENDRSTPGRGQVDWQTNFDALKQSGYDEWMVIEAFGLALPHLVAATKIWRRMYDDELQLAREGLAFMREQWASRT